MEKAIKPIITKANIKDQETDIDVIRNDLDEQLQQEI